MSRYAINSDKYSIHVGYDQPMRTFFATVEDPNLPEDEDSLLLWIGTKYDEIKLVDELQLSIADYTRLNDEIIQNLEADSKQPFKSTPLQQLTENLFSTTNENF